MREDGLDWGLCLDGLIAGLGFISCAALAFLEIWNGLADWWRGNVLSSSFSSKRLSR